MGKPRKPGAAGGDSAEADAIAVVRQVDDADIEAHAAGEIARHWYEARNWRRLEAVLTDIDMLDAILGLHRKAEIVAWWHAIEAEVGLRMEERYQEAWQGWALAAGPGPGRERARRMAMGLVGLLFEAGRSGDFPESLLRIAMQIDAEDHGEESSLVGLHLDMLARLLDARGDHAVAVEVSRRSIAIAERTEGADSWTVSVRLNTLAGIHLEMEDYRQAARLYRRSLAIAERAEGLYSEDLLTVLENLVNALLLAGEAGDAEPCARRIVTIAESVAEPDPLAVGRYVRGLASVLEAAGDHAGALPLHRRALATAEKHLGAGHPITLLCLVELAEALDGLGSAQESEALFRRALAAAEQDGDAADALVSRLVDGLGHVLIEQGRHADAVPYRERHLAMIDARPDGEADCVELATSLQQLGVAYRETGRYEEAGRSLLRARDVAAGIEAGASLIFAKVLASLGQLRVLEGCLGEAEELFGECLRIRRERLGAGHADIIAVEGRLRAVRRNGTKLT